jgi:hypothetical protein
MFPLIGGRYIQKINIHTKQTWSYINVYVKHVYKSRTILWNSGREGKEKGMIESQQYHNIWLLWR